MSTHSQSPGIQLNFAPKQQAQLAQRLMMSAQMQQALHMLQLPLQELETYIEEQIVNNPLIELGSEEQEGDGGDGSNVETGEESENGFLQEEKELSISDEDLNILHHLEEDLRELFSGSEAAHIKSSSEEDELQTYKEQSIKSKLSLQEELIQQALEAFDTPQEIEIAQVLIGYIDASGFLNTPLIEICSLHHFSEDKVLEILREIQSFEPYGIAASSIQESLLIQLRCLHKEHSLAYQIIQEHYDELIHNHIPSIQKQLKCPYKEIQAAIERDIAKLDLHPGMQFSPHATQAIVPDVTLRQEGEQLVVEVDRDFIPNLRLNSGYLKMLNDPETSTETKQYVKQNIFSAKWLTRNLHQRYSTLERIAQSLARRQVSFFTQADGELVPLTMQMLAEELELHESTVARTVSNKYMNTPRGLFPLRSFFTTKYITESGDDMSSSTIKQAIAQLIAEEDKKLPLSDEKISLILKEKGMNCARRTVAKYRIAMDIGNTQQRRKFIRPLT